MYKVSKTAYALIIFFFVTTGAKILGMDSKYKFNLSQEQLKGMINVETSETFVKYFNPCLSKVFGFHFNQERKKLKKAKLEKLKKEQASYNTVASWIYGSTLYLANDIFTYGGCQGIMPFAMGLGGITNTVALTAGIVACQKLNGAFFGGPLQERTAKMAHLKNKIAQLEEETKDVQITEEK